MPKKPTPSEEAEARLLALSDAQRRAVEVLLSGGTHSEAAEAAAVARETISRWVSPTRGHPAVVAALDAARMTAVAEIRDRVLRTCSKALGVLEAELDGGSLEAAKLALRVLPPALLADEFTTEVGPLAPAEILDLRARRLQLHLLQQPDADPFIPPAQDIYDPNFFNPEAARAVMDRERALHARARVERIAAEAYDLALEECSRYTNGD